MPAYSFLTDRDGDVWVFIGTRPDGTAVYDPAWAIAGVDYGDIPGEEAEQSFTEADIDRSYVVRFRGPQILPVHTAESDAADEYERTHTFVNVP
jgi:hypothetical protein